MPYILVMEVSIQYIGQNVDIFIIILLHFSKLKKVVFTILMVNLLNREFWDSLSWDLFTEKLKSRFIHVHFSTRINTATIMRQMQLTPSLTPSKLQLLALSKMFLHWVMCPLNKHCLNSHLFQHIRHRRWVAKWVDSPTKSKIQDQC